MNTLRRLLRTILAGLVIVVVAVGTGIALRDLRPLDVAGLDAAGRNEIAANGTVQGRLYPGNPEQEAQLVAREDDRLDYVRTVGTSIPWQVDGMDGAYRIPTTPAPTLVLPAREEAYTFEELRELAPETLVQESEGSFLLSENVVALPGATLQVASDTPLTIDLASNADSFVSIVVIGGAFDVSGTASAPVTFASRDAASGAADTRTDDGRAYVRVVGGTANIHHARFSDLGFWSGDTGGLALTGLDASQATADIGAPVDPNAPTTDPGSTDSTGSAADAEDGAPTLSRDQLAPLTAEGAPEPGLVTGELQDVWTTGNAFGLFVSRATGVVVSESRIRASLVDGIVFHRFVTDSSIAATESSGNAVDGVSIARSSSSIDISGLTSAQNGRNGVSFDGRPLADGPSASGTPVTAYGGISVTASTVADNARYGIEVLGGDGVTIADTSVSAGIVGVALNHGARNVEVSRDTLSGQSRQSLALSAGVEEVRIEKNAISSVDTGVHIRNAVAQVSENTFRDVSNHAVTLVGTATGTQVTGNSIAGHGSTPIHDDAVGGHIVGNDVEGWETPPTVASVLSTFLQPLTVIWILLALLLLFTALTGRRRRGIRHPYPERVPLTSLSDGVVSPESLRGAR
ncbi:right-handed parallel beta-helix repeat-containing protein [Agromyces bauzanensis]